MNENRHRSKSAVIEKCGHVYFLRMGNAADSCCTTYKIYELLSESKDLGVRHRRMCFHAWLTPLKAG
jgi:hypothetical protein